MSKSAGPLDDAGIEIDGVGKTFRWRNKGVAEEVVALGKVDFTVRSNEFLAVIGPSGCGKTTLLRTVAGLIKPDRGEIRVGGRPVTGPGEDRAVVFQHFGLFPWKTVVDNVKFPLRMRGVPDKEAAATARANLKKVGLEGFERSYPHQLSGGMQQRVGLARALATDARILLMDEPFGAIDAQTREFMQEQLMKLWDENKKTVVFVTHDLDEAVSLADRILVLSRRPSRVRAVVDVDLPRPRWDYDVRSEPAFAEARRTIWEMLRSDLVEEEEGAGIHAI